MTLTELKYIVAVAAERAARAVVIAAEEALCR